MSKYRNKTHMTIHNIDTGTQQIQEEELALVLINQQNVNIHNMI